MATRRRLERVSLRRDGSTLYTVLVCICGKSKKFTALADERDLATNALFTPIDKINKEIKASGWLEDAIAPNDWCAKCRGSRKPSTGWGGYYYYGGPEDGT